MTLLKNTEYVEAFQSLTEEEIMDTVFFREYILRNFGIMFQTARRKEPFKTAFPDCWGGSCMGQYPDEIARLLQFLYNKNITSFLEIGVNRGGTLFTIDSFLRARNPNLISVGVDKGDKVVRKHNFNEYKDLHKNITFINQNSREFKPDRFFDFIFLDGDHSYDGVKFDYENLKDNCKYMAFHDIGDIGKVERFWNEIKTQYKYHELFCQDERFNIIEKKLGIGIIEIHK